jgi:hypothetical protein
MEEKMQREKEFDVMGRRVTIQVTEKGEIRFFNLNLPLSEAERIISGLSGFFREIRSERDKFLISKMHKYGYSDFVAKGRLDKMEYRHPRLFNNIHVFKSPEPAPQEPTEQAFGWNMD